MGQLYHMPLHSPTNDPKMTQKTFDWWYLDKLIHFG
jgi:hypothetical protein